MSMLHQQWVSARNDYRTNPWDKPMGSISAYITNQILLVTFFFYSSMLPAALGMLHRLSWLGAALILFLNVL